MNFTIGKYEGWHKDEFYRKAEIQEDKYEHSFPILQDFVS